MPKLSPKEQALLESMGIKLSNEDYIRPVEEEEHTKDMARWEAESLLRSLNWPYPELVSVECWNPTCKKIFLTNYKANVYCSMECDKIELERKGIVWDPDKPFDEQWGYREPPLMIPPEAIKAMRHLLSLVDQESPEVFRSPKPDSVPEHTPALIPFSPAPPIPYSDPDIQEEHEEEPEDDFLAILNALDE